MTSANNESTTASEVKTQSMGLQWTGRILTVLTILFMLIDAFGKFTKPVYVTDAFARLGAIEHGRDDRHTATGQHRGLRDPPFGSTRCRVADRLPRRCGRDTSASGQHHFRASISRDIRRDRMGWRLFAGVRLAESLPRTPVKFTKPVPLLKIINGSQSARAFAYRAGVQCASSCGASITSI